MSIGWCAMVGRHKGLFQDHRKPVDMQLPLFSPKTLKQLNEEFREFLDHVKWEDEGGSIYEKA